MCRMEGCCKRVAVPRVIGCSSAMGLG
jgi:hypothetical protein